MPLLIDPTKVKWAVEHACTPHEKDPSVLLTDDPRGLHAIHYPRVSAVIYNRDVPEELLLALQGIKPKDLDMHSFLYNRLTHHPNESPMVAGQDMSLPHIIQDDLKYIQTLSSEITHQDYERPYLTRQFNNTSIQGLIDFHTDGGALRFISTYMGRGTLWLPQPALADEKQKSLLKKYNQAAIGERWNECQKIGKKLNVQEIPNLAIAVFIGRGYPLQKENNHPLFCHAEPPPTAGVPRLFAKCDPAVN